MKISKELYEKHWNSLNDSKKSVINSYHSIISNNINTGFIIFFIALFFSLDNLIDRQFIDSVIFLIITLIFYVVAITFMIDSKDKFNDKFFEVKIKDAK